MRCRVSSPTKALLANVPPSLQAIKWDHSLFGGFVPVLVFSCSGLVKSFAGRSGHVSLAVLELRKDRRPAIHQRLLDLLRRVCEDSFGVCASAILLPNALAALVLPRPLIAFLFLFSHIRLLFRDVSCVGAYLVHLTMYYILGQFCYP